MPVIQQAIEHSCHGCGVAEQFGPVLDRPIGLGGLEVTKVLVLRLP
jgi:hypothetical protein